MRKVIVCALAVLFLTACEKVKSLADIKFSVPNTQTFTVDGLSGNPNIPVDTGLKASIPTITIPTNSEEYIKQYNTSSALITEVKLGELKLEALEPSTQNFDMVDSLWLYVSADGLPEILAASYFDIPKGLRTLELETTDENVKEYFLKENMSFKIEGFFRSAPDSGSVFSLISRFDVVANPLNSEG